MAQLAEQSLSIPEVRGSNPVISKKLFKLNIFLLSTVHWKEKEAGDGPFLRTMEMRLVFDSNVHFQLRYD